MYTVRETPPKHIQDELEAYDPLTQLLLYNRGIETKELAEFFFKKQWFNIDPYIYSDMLKAAEKIVSTIATGGGIGIYSDYDCDGIPAAAALYSTLGAFGHTKITYYVPNRNVDGFGLNDEGVATMIGSGVEVVCILDCGTSDPTHVAKLEDAGIKVIILDHHLPGEVSPDVFAMINPTIQEGIDEPYPCAAGMTYLFIQAVIDQAHKTKLPKKPSKGWEKWQLDVVSLATLSDMVPLQGINRQFAYYGLQVLRKSPRPGIQVLCRALKIKQEKLSQEDISFLIIPRINAASRMGSAHLAFELLTTNDVVRATDIAEALTDLNNKRKTTVATMVREANRQARIKDRTMNVWVFGNRQWKPSLVGLVAQRLVDTYNKTIFVWGQSDSADGPKIKGSCRSKKDDTFSMMQSLPELFLEAGGHKQAGGFTLTGAAELVLEEKLNQVVTRKDNAKETHYVDSACSISDVPRIVEVCEQFAPFGMKNEAIHIALLKCHIQKKIRFGKKREHIRYTFSDETNSVLDGITFFQESDTIPEGKTLNAVIGCLEWDAFRNKVRIRVLYIDP